MAYITHLFTERYLLNIFSTNHSPKEKSTIGCCFGVPFWNDDVFLNKWVMRCVALHLHSCSFHDSNGWSRANRGLEFEQ